MTGLEFLLEKYDRIVKQFKKDMEGEIHITIKLDDVFLRTCRDRIIAGHKTYGEDYREKDCIKERTAETYDYFNYTILDAIQKEINSVK